MNGVAIWGVGTSHFGKQPDTPMPVLAWHAVMEALDDAATQEVDAVFAGSVFGDPGVTQRCLHDLGIVEVPIVTIENACASSTSALHEAAESIRAGRYERVLAFGIEAMTAHFQGAVTPIASDPEGRQGFAMPSLYGMAATRYMHEYDVTAEQLALVSVKNHEHGMGNSRAQHRRRVTLAEVLGSRLVSDPLTLLQCCSIADAAAAAVLGPARGNPHDVTLRASALRSGARWDHLSSRVWGWDLVHDTAAAVYEAAGVGPADLDVLEVHDAFTIGELVTCEALGLCDVGAGARLVESGHTWLGGAQPVNPSGGLLSRGHPLGATGLAQVAEIDWQLRGCAEGRQVEAARLGLVETMGGGAAGIDGNGCVVALLGN
jgi:acetyl-CoA acetyltransferase